MSASVSVSVAVAVAVAVAVDLVAILAQGHGMQLFRPSVAILAQGDK